MLRPRQQPHIKHFLYENRDFINFLHEHYSDGSIDAIEDHLSSKVSEDELWLLTDSKGAFPYYGGSYMISFYWCMLGLYSQLHWYAHRNRATNIGKPIEITPFISKAAFPNEMIKMLYQAAIFPWPGSVSADDYKRVNELGHDLLNLLYIILNNDCPIYPTFVTFIVHFVKVLSKIGLFHGLSDMEIYYVFVAIMGSQLSTITNPYFNLVLLVRVFISNKMEQWYKVNIAMMQRSFLSNSMSLSLRYVSKKKQTKNTKKRQKNKQKTQK